MNSDHQQIIDWLSDKFSMSEIAKRLGKPVSYVSRYCKKYDLRSFHEATPAKDLNMIEIISKYQSGISLYKLSKEYGVSQQTLKRRISKFKEIKIRNLDEAIRHPVLNSRERLAELMSSLSIRKIATLLKTRPNTVCEAVKRFNLHNKVRKTIQDVPTEEFISLYVDHNKSLTEIAKIYNTYPTSVLHRLNQANVSLRTSGGVRTGSKIFDLNDKNTLTELYINQQKSMAYIASVYCVSIGTISYHLHRLSIPVRDARDVNRLRLQTQTQKAELKITTKWGDLNLKSKQEVQFVKLIPDSVKNITYEMTELTYRNKIYTPDFNVDGQFVEVKPKSRAQKSGVDRRKFVHQLQITNKNDIRLKTWYDKNYYDYDPILTDDIFYAIDWRLFFNSHIELFEFLKERGWTHPSYPIDVLIRGITSWLRVQTDVMLNANISQPSTISLMRHFHESFYLSTHKDYCSVNSAFEAGNHRILCNAAEYIWQKKNSCNIYGLINAITVRFKDFSMVGMFKPWVARAVYDKLLPNGGIIVDPCCGWGGRMLACIESEYEYRGSDINQMNIAANTKLADFVGNNYIIKPKLLVKDATKSIDQGDLLFTSPPYDDTERYYGVDSLNTLTEPIYDNIFRSFQGRYVALNAPIRHEKMVNALAYKHGWKDGEHMKMKTGSFITREMTYEPILVYNRY